MSVDVTLHFIPPDDPDLGALRVYESNDIDGPFVAIDRATEIGEYPEWITFYVSSHATAKTNWFAIAWEDKSGAVGELSAPVQGDTNTLVGILISRTVLRDPSLEERLVAQVAEFVICDVMGVNDPYSVTDANFRQMEGMTLLTLARTRYQTLLVVDDNYTAGLVSEKASIADPAKVQKAIDVMIREANRILGRRFSVVAQMCVPEINRGLSRVVMADISRLQIDVE